MGTELDLDDVAATSHLAMKELADLRAELSAYKQAVQLATADDVAATGELTPSVYGKGWLACAQFVECRARELMPPNKS